MFFNINVNEVIHNLLYNKNKNIDSLIIVLIYVFKNFKFLKCKINSIEYFTTLIPNCIWNHIFLENHKPYTRQLSFLGKTILLLSASSKKNL
jgi:tryptophan-rich sensory protein